VKLSLALVFSGITSLVAGHPEAHVLDPVSKTPPIGFCDAFLAPVLEIDSGDVNHDLLPESIFEETVSSR
jgi:hypothetical protein